MHSTDIQWSAILSWGYADNILRLKSKQSEPPINFIQCSQLHQVHINTQSSYSGGSTHKLSDCSFLLSNRVSPCPPGDQLRLGARWLSAIHG